MAKRAGQPDGVVLEYGDRRDALIRGAIKLGARSGLRALTYRGVAAEVGVAHGLIAHHFGSIDALLEAALLRTIDDSIIDLDLQPESGRVADFAANLVKGVARTSDNYAFQYQVMLASRQSGDGRGHLNLLHTKYRAILAATLTEMRIPITEGVVELVYAALEGVVFHQVVHVENSINEQAITALRALLTSLKEVPDHAI